MSPQEVADRVHLLRSGRKTRVELVLSDPLVIAGGAFLVLVLHQLVELILVVQFQPNGDFDHQIGIYRAFVHRLLDEAGGVVGYAVVRAVDARGRCCGDEQQ